MSRLPKATRCLLLYFTTALVGLTSAHSQDGGPFVPLQKEPYLPPGAPTRPATAKNWADFISGGLVYLNDYGLSRKIAAKLEDLKPKILNDLPYSKGGVLVVVRLETQQNDAGAFRNLIADRLDYVGLGASPADAELSRIARGDNDPFYVVSQGRQLDYDNSVAYWFRRDKDGELVAGEQSLASLRQQTLSLYADRELNNFDWKVARNNEIERLVTAFREVNVRAAANQQVDTLAESRRRTLEELKDLNRQLQDALDRAAKAAETAKILQILYIGAQFADFSSKASEGFAPKDQEAIKGQTTREGVFSELDRMNKESMSKGNTLREEIRVKTNVVNGIETQIITIFRENAVPTENIPPNQLNVPPPR
ncbi:hypothetical protein CI1B_27630 [Bradyrhizobium ivorense]|uniref:Chromosome partition protein Smc n=1 Tax=Bradyrhizobium ivorense TaxID=2511166 RepID=A0A508T8M5_9BRAD|nr:hypothetical protein [Bradyrhizobium ivorense]VIO69557.1 hypothetical protein CI1B_27630 [Bradyrhizobium ivorense]VIO71303.1 hypothetical protein CI41S_29740 [Bradyrhizobium ivorense]